MLKVILKEKKNSISKGAFENDVEVNLYTCLKSTTIELPWWLSGKESACRLNAGDMGSIPGLERYHVPWRH